MLIKAQSCQNSKSLTFRNSSANTFATRTGDNSFINHSCVRQKSIVMKSAPRLKTLKVTLQDIAANLSKKLEIDENKAKNVIQETLKEIQNYVLQGERVTFQGFGSFHRVERTPRTVRNPKTGEKFLSEPSATVKFVVGKKFKDTLNEESSSPKESQNKGTPVEATS